MAEGRRGGKKNRKHGRNKRKPSFMRYWQKDGQRLKRRKARNLIRCCGFSEARAIAAVGL